MQRRFCNLLQPRLNTALSADALFSAHRAASSGRESGGTSDDEDPAAVLKKLQEDMRKRSIAEGKTVPPAPPRRSGKTPFFEDGLRSGSASDAREGRARQSSSNVIEEAPRATAVGSTQANAKQSKSSGAHSSNPFLQKLSKMEAETQSTSFPTYDAAAEERRKKIDAKIKEERSKMLIFRDVGMDLDKPILSRDVFLVFKYFRYGIEFAVDNELERMLRYFNEHAMNELKIIQDSKLMRGPPTLSRKRRHASRSKASAHSSGNLSAKVEDDETTMVRQQKQPLQFQISSLFPQVRCANTRQFCSPDCVTPAAAGVLSSLLPSSHGASSFASLLPSAVATDAAKASAASAKRLYNAKDDSLFTTMSPSMFRRPAVVIYSQLGQKFGSQADTEWRRLAYASICPGLLPYVPMPSDATKEVKDGSADAQSPYGLREHALKGKEGTVPRAMPIDVVSMRSADVYKYGWVQRMYVNRFAKSLSQASPSGSAGEPSVQSVNQALIASTTFVGSQLLEPFYTTLGVRNYLLPHVMLVDHEGVIRWLSGGCPDANEKAVFSSLLKQLESEYYKASK